VTADPDKEIVDAVLGSLEESDDLRAALLDLRSLATGPAPVPSAELLVAMSPNVTRVGAHRARVALAIGIGAVVSITAGIGSAAAVIPEFREAVVTTVTAFVETVSGTSGDDAPGTPDDSTPTVPNNTDPTPTSTATPPGADNFPNPRNTHAPNGNPGTGTPGGGSSKDHSNNGKSGEHPHGKPTENPSANH
jgi:hypothetical protein